MNYLTKAARGWPQCPVLVFWYWFILFHHFFFAPSMNMDGETKQWRLKGIVSSSSSSSSSTSSSSPSSSFFFPKQKNVLPSLKTLTSPPPLKWEEARLRRWRGAAAAEEPRGGLRASCSGYRLTEASDPSRPASSQKQLKPKVNIRDSFFQPC